MEPYPDPRRVVTGHDDAGNAIFLADSEIKGETIGNDKLNFAVLWETFQFPASNDKFEDPILQRTQSLANSKGVVFRVVDFPPNKKTVRPSPHADSLMFNELMADTVVPSHRISGLWDCHGRRNHLVSDCLSLRKFYTMQLTHLR